MVVDLHNHTPLCNHAQGDMEQYIQSALQNKTQYFGFADHAPMDFDQKYRMSFEQMRSYQEDVLFMKEKYAQELTILLGYEVDYLPGHIDTRVLNADVDYLIGSVHFIDKWGFDNPEFIAEYDDKDIDTIWEQYFTTLLAMVQSGHFDIVGHLDLIKVFKFLPTKNIVDIASDTLHAIKTSGMVLEINGAGYRKPIAEAYPSKELLHYAYELGIDITLSSDAHTPQQVGLYGDQIVALAKSIGYTKCCYFEKKEKKYIEL